MSLHIERHERCDDHVELPGGAPVRARGATGSRMPKRFARKLRARVKRCKTQRAAGDDRAGNLTAAAPGLHRQWCAVEFTRRRAGRAPGCARARGRAGTRAGGRPEGGGAGCRPAAGRCARARILRAGGAGFDSGLMGRGWSPLNGSVGMPLTGEGSGLSRLCRCSLLLSDQEHQVGPEAAEQASRPGLWPGRSCTNCRQYAVPKARLRVERPIKPLSNTAGETCHKYMRCP